MTRSTSGIPLPMGLTLKMVRAQSLPLHGNGLPKKFIVNLEDNKAVIYSILNTIDELNKSLTPVKKMKFMEIPLTTIKTNVPMLKIFNGSYVLFNFELKAYGSMVGDFNLGTGSGDMVIPKTLFLLEQAMPALLEELKIDYGAPTFDFYVLSSGGTFFFTRILEEVILKTIQTFIDLNRDYTDLDITNYVNLVASAFASMENEVWMRYQSPSYDSTELTVGNKLRVIDAPFVNRLESNTVLDYRVSAMKDTMNDAIHMPLTSGDDPENLVGKLVDVTNQISRVAPSYFKANQFILDITGRIAGLINMCLMLGIMGSQKSGASAGIYFAFAYPEKFIATTE